MEKQIIDTKNELKEKEKKINELLKLLGKKIKVIGCNKSACVKNP